MVLIREENMKKLQSPSQTALQILREYFPMHLLKSEVDLRYIQGLPGQNSSKTTVIYTRVIKASPTQIKNPLNSLMDDKT